MPRADKTRTAAGVLDVYKMFRRDSDRRWCETEHQDREFDSRAVTAPTLRQLRAMYFGVK